MKNKQDIIAGSFLFEGVSLSQLVELAEISVRKKIRRGETIFFEGDDAIGFYMVIEGKVYLSDYFEYLDSSCGFCIDHNISLC